jgi:transposase
MLDKQIEKLRRRTFTVEFKVEAVKLKRDQRLSYAEVGRRLDVLPKLIQQWEKQYDAGELSPEKAKRQITPERQELSELRAQLARLKMENAILKKAAAYFARESL